jgi:archaellum component FlaF (FlaF/FlaG flagellin family)
MIAKTVFRVAILLLLVCLGMLFVAAAKTYNAIDGSATDDGEARLCFSSVFRAA